MAHGFKEYVKDAMILGPPLVLGVAGLAVGKYVGGDDVQCSRLGMGIGANVGVVAGFLVDLVIYR